MGQNDMANQRSSTSELIGNIWRLIAITGIIVSLIIYLVSTRYIVEDVSSEVLNHKERIHGLEIRQTEISTTLQNLEKNQGRMDSKIDLILEKINKDDS